MYFKSHLQAIIGIGTLSYSNEKGRRDMIPHQNSK